MRKFTLILASLFLSLGAMAQTLADGVYTIQADENGKRGYLAASDSYERPVLTEISWTNYSGNSCEDIMENGKYWYLKTEDGVSYLYNIAKGKFVMDNATDDIYFGAPYGFNVTEHTVGSVTYIHVGSGTGTRFLSMGCGATAPNQVKWEKGNANDGGCLLTFTLVENVTTDFATQIEQAKTELTTGRLLAWKESVSSLLGCVGGYPESLRADIEGVSTYTEALAFDAEHASDKLELTTGAYYRLVCVSPKTGNGGNTSYNTLTWNGESHLVTSPMDIENDNQVFLFEDAGNSKYYLKNVIAGKYLNKISAGNYRSQVVDKESACKVNVVSYAVAGQFKLHNSESSNSNHCLFAENHPTETVPYACAGWDNGANSASAWRLVSVEAETLLGAGEKDSPYLINNVDELILFRNSVNAGETKYSAPGVYVALGADIDLAGQNWVGIGSMNAEHGFMGNFDGNGKTIKNLTIDNPALIGGAAYAGLFSLTEGVDENNQNYVKDLTIENVTINTTGQIAAAAIAYAYYTIVENVTVCGDISIKGGDYTAGALAYTRRCVNASNITVAGNAGSTITGAKTVGGVISDIQMNGGLIADYSKFNVSGVTITGTKAVGGIAGIIAGQTLNGCSVENVILVADGQVGIVAGSLGAASTITGEVYSNVTGADAIIGAGYDTGTAVEAQVGDTYYSTLADAVKAENDVTLLTDVTLKDDVAYASTSSKTVTGKITYTRNLIAGWNPIYLPFATELSTEKYDVATFTSAEGETVTLTKIEDATATLAANTAYVIRPKNEAAKTLTIALTDATLEAATVNTQELGEGFSVKGNYNKLTGAKLGANDRVVGTNGNWGVLKSTSTLKPYRLILTIPATAKAISMRVEGEDVTSIENLGITIEGDVIFDLMGRRVETMTEGGIYIVNGKKIVF